MTQRRLSPSSKTMMNVDDRAPNGQNGPQWVGTGAFRHIAAGHRGLRRRTSKVVQAAQHNPACLPRACHSFR